MDVALGAVIDDGVAQIALLDAAPPHPVIDRSQVDLAGTGVEDLVATLVATDRMLTDTGHRLVSTRISGDGALAAQVVDALAATGLANVIAVSESAAAAAAEGPAGSQTAALATAQGENTALALAAGAAMTGMTPTAAAPAVGAASADPSMTQLSPQGPQLAYSEVDDDEAWAPTQLDEADDEDWAATEYVGPPQRRARPRALLVGSTFAAAVVVGFAALAVGVAVGVSPTASRQDVRAQEPAVPGNYFPNSPGQGVQRDGDNWTVIEHVPAKGVRPSVRTFEPVSLARPATAANSLIDVYPDGTFGVRNAAAPLPPIAPPVPNVTGGIDPIAPILVSRLIPNFGLYTPLEVLYYMSNMAPATVIAGANAVNIVASSLGPTLAQLGAVVAVSPLQGALFAADTAAALAAPFNPVRLTNSIPAQLFSQTITPAQKSELLPAGVTEISDLPETAADAGLNPLSTPITDVNALNPTVVGSGPELVQEKESPPVFPDLATVAPEIAPETSPATESPALTSPGEQTPASETPPTEPGESREQPSPGQTTPASEVPESQTPASEGPASETPARTTEAPTRQTTAERPAETSADSPTQQPAVTQEPTREMPTERPAPTQQEPTYEAPTREAPTQEAPTYEAPTYEAPTYEAPTREIPAPQAPTRQIPTQEAPKMPSMPTMKMPDFGGDSSE
ncbi:hypothetical protein A5643_07815 [Mycobacterium sp. 1274756.6]|nr:hypothetical protein A5643_07815 [Mycobacterium sp. 1274756.6]